ncbi:MAG: redoxin domain-containing protein [Clostridia bacterium]|nr:redoxin domain-containing protein [Clostridia bacterium]
MPEKFKAGCQRPKSNQPIVDTTNTEVDSVEKGEKKMVQVGQKAPDFELSGYFKGEFMTFKLSEFVGKWVVLCFYPGDFTFV